MPYQHWTLERNYANLRKQTRNSVTLVEACLRTFGQECTRTLAVSEEDWKLRLHYSYFQKVCRLKSHLQVWGKLEAYLVLRVSNGAIVSSLSFINMWLSPCATHTTILLANKKNAWLWWSIDGPLFLSYNVRNSVATWSNFLYLTLIGTDVQIAIFQNLQVYFCSCMRYCKKLAQGSSSRPISVYNFDPQILSHVSILPRFRYNTTVCHPRTLQNFAISRNINSLDWQQQESFWDIFWSRWEESISNSNHLHWLISQPGAKKDAK